MPENKTGFLGLASALMALAFVIGFFVSLLSLGQSGVLYHFALKWELTGALLYLAAWAPSILLVASALALESSDASDRFSGAARTVLLPALILAALVSIYFLLIVPGMQERKARYESQSALFTNSIQLAETALKEMRLDDASRYLIACGAIDQHDERFTSLYDRVQSELVKASNAELGQPEAQTTSYPENEAWVAGNHFYLEALEARKDGRHFDAHYLARRSAEIYDKRPEVKKLVDETWRSLEKLGPSVEELEAAALYKRKLEGYARLQEGDYLAAYRIYSELSTVYADDLEISTYLKKSGEGLSQIAFFIEEDERAFSKSDRRSFSIQTIAEDGNITKLASARIAISPEAVYFRDAIITTGGEKPSVIRASFARLHQNVLILRAVDRTKPEIVWDPVYETGQPSVSRGETQDPGYAVQVPFNQQDVVAVVRLSGNPKDIALDVLATAADVVDRFGLDVQPLLTELGRRAAYPFTVIILVLLGAGLGIRFKAIEPPGTLKKYLTAPILVALALAPISAGASIGLLAVKVVAAWVPRALFLPAWLGFMGGCTALSLFIAARIAGRTVR
jgi:lipopolysaccharide export LptBFGC system permease protein LptF